jgi:hypothetical protein
MNSSTSSSDTGKKGARRFFLKMALLVALLWPVLHVFASFYYERAPLNTENKCYWIMSKRNTSVDVGFIGSSRVENAINAPLFATQTGFSAINLGIEKVNYAGSLALLHCYFRNGNKLDYLFIQLDHIGLGDPDSIFVGNSFPEQYLLGELDDDSVASVVSENTPYLKFLARKYVPEFAYVEYGSTHRFPLLIKGRYTNGINYDASNGSKLVDDAFDGKLRDTLYRRTVSESSVSYLVRIVALARRSGCEPVFFWPPCYRPYLRQEQSYESFRERARQISASLNVRYFDLQELPMSAQPEFFYNSTHPNTRGANIITLALADSLAVIRE